jgi:cell division protein FtsQ
VTPKNRRIDAKASPHDGAASDGPRHAIPADDEAAAGTGRKILAAARAVLGAGLVIGLSTTVAWAARRHILESPRFALEDLVITGTHQRTPETIANEAGISKGMNVFGLDLDRARAKLLRDPWVASVTLARRLPKGVVVRVTEREVAAIVALPETYLATRDGQIFKRLEPDDVADLPVITGITEEAVAQDREGVRRTVVRALDLVSDYERGPLASKASLEEVHVSNGGDLTLVVGKDATSLALGQPPFRHKLDEAARIFSELEHRGARASIVMLDDEARPDRVVVRTR